MNRTEIEKQIEDYCKTQEYHMKEIENISKSIADLEKQLKDERVFKFAEKGSAGHEVMGNGIPTSNLFKRVDYNQFYDKESAEKFGKMQKLWQDIWKWQSENDERVKVNYYKPYYVIRANEGGFYVDSFLNHTLFTPIFSSQAKAQECLEVFRDRLTEIVGWFA